MRSKAIVFFVPLFCVAFLAGCSKPAEDTSGATLAEAAMGAGRGPVLDDNTLQTGPGMTVGADIGMMGGAIAGVTIEPVDKENTNLAAEVKRNQQLIEENARLIDELKKRGADVRSSKRGVVINLPDILFNFDRAELTPEAERTINEIADVLKGASHRRLAVEGHTDSVGAVVYNKQLSYRRANSVAAELSKHGVPRSRMKVSGFGEGRAIATNNTKEGRDKNRRVEIIIENY